ncbi:hypothetical protein G6F35_013852 [Rhizopus arrhizus]|nr:hypothetical protein G6F35_013852 [Rhizopus arrhizus]
MDYIADEEQFRLETLSSHTQYLAQLALKSEKEIETMQVEKEVVKPCSDAIMRETSVKRNYTRYCDQDKVRFFKLLFEKCLSAATAANNLGFTFVQHRNGLNSTRRILTASLRSGERLVVLVFSMRNTKTLSLSALMTILPSS